MLGVPGVRQHQLLRVYNTEADSQNAWGATPNAFQCQEVDHVELAGEGWATTTAAISRLDLTVSSNERDCGRSPLFDGYAFGQIAWLIDIGALQNRNVIGQQLQGNRIRHR